MTGGGWEQKEWRDSCYQHRWVLDVVVDRRRVMPSQKSGRDWCKAAWREDSAVCIVFVGRVVFVDCVVFVLVFWQR